VREEGSISPPRICEFVLIRQRCLASYERDEIALADGGRKSPSNEFSKMNGEAVTKFARAAIFHGG